MRLFLDASVILAACGRVLGASHAIFDMAVAQSWLLLASHYVIREVDKNVRLRLSAGAQLEWQRLRPALSIVSDELTHPWPVIFPAAKDRPVLFTAAACADLLLTLDQADFECVMGAGFYGLPVMKPADFLRRERAAGRLIP
jgi:hypothetical protein